MTHDCACSRPIHDTATVCPHCGYLLDAALAEVVAFRGLAYDLDIAAAKQTHLRMSAAEAVEERRVPGVLPATPLPYNPRPANVAGELKAVLVTWARIVAGDTGAVLTEHDDTIAAAARWLRPYVGWLRYHEAGQEAVDAICDAVAAGWRVVDRRPELLYAGRCDCGADLYARLDAEYVTCRAEVHEDGPLVWPVAERRRWLLRSAEDVLATTTEISRALTRYAQPITPEAIRGYKARGRLVAKGERVENGRVVPLYRLGDVLAIVAPEQEKASA